MNDNAHHGDTETRRTATEKGGKRGTAEPSHGRAGFSVLPLCSPCLRGEAVDVLREFGERVKAHPLLEIVTVCEDPEEVFSSTVTLGLRPPNELDPDDAKWPGFEVELSEIVKHGVDRVIACALHEDTPRILTHMTRIVGYFSNVHNWNRSKLAELADRRKGSYAVAESTHDPKGKRER